MVTIDARTGPVGAGRLGRLLGSVLLALIAALPMAQAQAQFLSNPTTANAGVGDAPDVAAAPRTARREVATPAGDESGRSSVAAALGAVSAPPDLDPMPTAGPGSPTTGNTPRAFAAPGSAEVGRPAPGDFGSTYADGPIRRRRPNFFAVARESIFGPADDPPWQPLPLRTFWTEGWRDPWINPPNGSGGAPRQGWIGAADGNFYRLYWFSYIENFHVVQGGNGYVSRYNLYTPLSRRLLLITTIPYVNSNSPSFNLGTADFGSSGAATNLQSGRGTSFGDLTFTPRVLLKETQDFSLSAQLAVQIPTGSTSSGAGRAILTPGVQFWQDIGRGWAVRGGFNVGVGVNRPGTGTTLISQLALGRTITPHDRPIFGDFTYYLAVNASNQLDPTALTTVTLGPGFRTHLGRDYYLLGAVIVPVTGPQPYDENLTVWLMKTF